MPKDYLVRATAADGGLRALAAVTTNLVEEARRRHRASRTATAALGRALTAALLLGAELKFGQSVTLRVLGDGPLGAVVAVANGNGEVRGYVQHPEVDLPPRPDGKLDVGGAVGRNGILNVARDLGLKEPYSGSVPLVSGEVAEDLAHYFVESEQTPTAVALGVMVNPKGRVIAAGGYICQLLPGADEELADRLTKRLSLVDPVTSMVLRGLTPEGLLAEALGLDFQIHQTLPVVWRCTCSRTRLAEILLALGREELEDMLRRQGGAEVRCRFCNQVYYFSAPELQEIIARVGEETTQS